MSYCFPIPQDAARNRAILGTVVFLLAGVMQAVGALAGPPDPDPVEANKPWDGLFYGNPTHADTVSSTPIRGGEAVWLRVPIKRSGVLTGVLFEVRRCRNAESAANPSPGNYSHGDGGKLRFQVRAIGADGKPTTNVLARSQINNGFAGPLCSNGLWNTEFSPYQVWQLDPPARVKVGQRVALWVQNEDSDPAHQNWSASNFMELYAPIPYGRGQREGPYYGDDPKCVRVRWWGQEQERKGSGGVWELRYADGFADGVPYFFSTGQLRKNIGGRFMVRQKFTVRDYARTVDGLWFRAFWETGTPADLLARLEDDGHEVLGEIHVPRAEITRTRALQGDTPALWVHKRFPEPCRLEQGRTYYLRLSAVSGTYVVHPMQMMEQPLSRSRNRWDGAYAQYTTNAGATWIDGWDRADQAGIYRKDVVLSVAFTVARP